MTLLCSQPLIHRPNLDHLDPRRAQLIASRERIWLRGTTLTYHFMNSPAIYAGSTQDVNLVREAFDVWSDIGIDITFKEVDAPEEAMIRIGFAQGDGSWSYIGRDAIDFIDDHQQRTMNFGWPLTRAGDNGLNTALHEIGHALGFTHSHQNPNAGIIWNDERVYRTYAGRPNYWDRRTIEHNILNKEPQSAVVGSAWDKDSIMQYQFPAGIIVSPEEYQTEALTPAPGLSDLDISTALSIYPKQQLDMKGIELCESQKVDIAQGQEIAFAFTAPDTRRYTFQTFGQSDTLLVLYEMRQHQEDHYIAGDDDAGGEFNAQIQQDLIQGNSYMLKLRLYYAERSGETCVMVY